MTNQQLWQAIIGDLEVTLSKANFSTWFKNTGIIEKEDDYIVVGVPSNFTRNWISEKYHTTMLKALKSIAPEVKTIRYYVGHFKPENATQPSLMDSAPNSTAKEDASERTENLNPGQKSTAAPKVGGLNPQYTFETFVVGQNSELAYAASTAVAKTPGSQYNPLFIYGGVGLGKTHLMHAIGNKLLQSDPNLKILYVTSEKFTNDYVAALGQKRMDSFKALYRNVDMLLVDDIQFIAGKEQTQEVFFHTFNELRDKGKQIILTADRLPRDIPAIEQRLVSRFEWGMVADISAPNLETRIAILQTKLGKKGVVIDKEITEFIAENVVNNIRELEGALNKLLIYQQIENKPLTLDQAKNILASIVNAKKKAVTLSKIAESVANFYSITMEDLLKQSRRKEYVKPRQTAMYLARKELGSSFPSIGEFFGGRDHTTVMHGVEKVEKAVTANDGIKQEMELILEKIYN
ncbi:MAG TPA: chromosomal replication initiator protein DnaA [Patescibacteria group bacterium]|jgi:chromosomal replication initiator protein|nr:chromosomal replication initiator protein DnaA [Patescibacteria group bacterium]